MNPRTSSGSADPTNVEELRRQIETALGSVEEIVKNNAVISVDTSPSKPAASDEDEVVVYVSIKINKNEESHHYNGASATSNGLDGFNGLSGSNGLSGPNGINGSNGLSGYNGGVHPPGDEAGRILPAGPGPRKVRTEGGEMSRTQVTGQAIKPRRRLGAPGLGRSVTAPCTPVRTVRDRLLRSRSVEQARDSHTKSLENLDGAELGDGQFKRIRRVRSRQSLRERVWLPGKRESFNIHVKKNFVSHPQPASDKGKLQYYYLEHVVRHRSQAGDVNNDSAE